MRRSRYIVKAKSAIPARKKIERICRTTELALPPPGRNATAAASTRMIAMLRAVLGSTARRLRREGSRAEGHVRHREVGVARNRPVRRRLGVVGLGGEAVPHAEMGV